MSGEQLTPENNWTYCTPDDDELYFYIYFDGPKDYTKYDYKIEEVGYMMDGVHYEGVCPGYTPFYEQPEPTGETSINEYEDIVYVFESTLTNTIDTEYTNVGVQKVWDDDGDAYKIRPEYVNATLFRRASWDDGVSWSDFTPIDTAVVAEYTGWRYDWYSLPRRVGLLTGKHVYYDYKVDEITVPPDYDKEVTMVSGAPNYSFTIKNSYIPSYMTLHKDSKLPLVTNDNKCYSLAGAKYQVYADANCTQVATYWDGAAADCAFITDANGNTGTIRLKPGTYYAKETYAPKGFYQDKTVYPVTVTKNHTKDAPMKLTVTDEPKNDPLSIRINKIQDGPANGSLPSLEGAEFTITYYDSLEAGVIDRVKAGTEPAKRVWVIKTRKIGNSYGAMLLDRYKVSGDDFYKMNWATSFFHLEPILSGKQRLLRVIRWMAKVIW